VANKGHLSGQNEQNRGNTDKRNSDDYPDHREHHIEYTLRAVIKCPMLREGLEQLYGVEMVKRYTIENLFIQRRKF
jgi:hypothetical protein